ncbi:hypothetical protein L0P88_04360 [Muricauda sp. SCSIO 64092]|uniref:hypothetical protein n=1 Tax=Allomuricauda sp. SCSIO 64092 TaxID=2908842 RepID=UPI001FF6868D|nr:hypothetical protein [Muricauda sp. SCSIO 64092]UOY07788.1 hypothetical protein L0P88_04360 [Muricauda sp. SCSIO 64092]
MNIYVFKTSIEPRDIKSVNELLRTLIPNCKWNYDLEDCDNILRVESRKNIAKLISFHLGMDGFYCEELE